MKISLTGSSVTTRVLEMEYFTLRCILESCIGTETVLKSSYTVLHFSCIQNLMKNSVDFSNSIVSRFRRESILPSGDFKQRTKKVFDLLLTPPPPPQLIKLPPPPLFNSSPTPSWKFEIISGVMFYLTRERILANQRRVRSCVGEGWGLRNPR